jgi:WD40 repeat protein
MSSGQMTVFDLRSPLAQNVFLFVPMMNPTIGYSFAPFSYLMLTCVRWVSKMVKKKFKSTVLCCAFHPQNGQLLATGAADFKCRIYSTFDSSVDGPPNAGPFTNPLEFGEAYCELSAGGWVTAVAWSPSGNTLAFAG